MNIHESMNPRHTLGPLNKAVAVFAALSLIVGCIVLPPVPDPDPTDHMPGTTTTTTTTSTSTTTTTLPPDNAGLTLPQFLYGGIGAGDWPAMDSAQYAGALTEAGCNSHLIEAIAAAFDKSDDGYNSMTIDQVGDKLIAWVRVMQAARVWTCIHMLNGNDEVWQHFTPGHMRSLVTRLADECGTTYIVLIPVAEMTDDDRDSEFAQWCIGFWHDQRRGICGWNGRGRPQTVPAGVQVCDYHLQALNDFGPDLRSGGVITLLDTDNGPAINSLRGYWNPDKVQNWAGEYRRAGRSLNLYQFQSTEIDVEALKRVGDAYK
mgnify:CR=1 FL=1